MELTTQQVLTVSPTLGDESLQQGLVAAIAGLVLAAYLLFYYRILAVVAWVGMTIWAILALGLVALAGRSIGYNLTLGRRRARHLARGHRRLLHRVLRTAEGRGPRRALAPSRGRTRVQAVVPDDRGRRPRDRDRGGGLVRHRDLLRAGFALTLGVATLLDLFVVYFFKRPAVSLLTRSERLVNWRVMGIKAGLAADRELRGPDVVPAIAGV